MGSEVRKHGGSSLHCQGLMYNLYSVRENVSKDFQDGCAFLRSFTVVLRKNIFPPFHSMPYDYDRVVVAEPRVASFHPYSARPRQTHRINPN